MIKKLKLFFALLTRVYLKLLAITVSTFWTSDDKNLLSKALQKHGTSDISAIAKDIPNKTVEEVRNAIKKYKDLAAEELKTESSGEDVPLDTWFNIIKDVSLEECEINPLERALKYIALFEKREQFEIDFTFVL